MHLSAELVGHYQATTAALLEYANTRLGVVQRLPPFEEQVLMRQRMALIGRELWRNLAVIEGFVRENPDGLPASEMELVREWHHGIPGTCIIVGYEPNGNAIVEHEAGTFSVRGIAREVAEVAPPTPVAFKTALLPFDGSIVFGMPVDPIGHVDDVAVRTARSRARASGFAGVVTTAEGLLARSAAYRPVRMRAQLRSLGSTFEPAPVPAGYHRGPLAGLGTDERIAASDDRIFEVLDSLGEECDEPVEGRAGGQPDGGRALPPLLSSELREITKFVGACTTLYGVLSLPEAYDQYRAVSDAPIARRRFYDTLVRRAGDISAGHGIWSHHGVRYVVAPSLTEASARLVAVRRLRAGRAGGMVVPARGRRVAAVGDVGQASHVIERLTREAYLQAQEQCVVLVACQGRLPRRRVERRMVERGMTRYLLDLEPVGQLVDFVSGRIPDGKDDYLFADEVVGQIVRLFITTGAEVGEAFSLLERVGMAGCEGGVWSDTLGRMVVNVFNALPRWDMDGWSLTQVTERLTGRTTFYAPDGTPMRVGADEPCPCGSGMRYRQCCGR